MFMQVVLFRSFPANEAHKLSFSGGPNWGVLGGGQKAYVEREGRCAFGPSPAEAPRVESGPVPLENLLKMQSSGPGSLEHLNF